MLKALLLTRSVCVLAMVSGWFNGAVAQEGSAGQMPHLFSSEPPRGAISCGPAIGNALAEYPGGMDSLRAFLHRSFVRPVFAGSDTLHGTIRIQFSVDIDGSTGEILVKNGLHPVFDQEAERVVRSMPRWAPARSDGKAVKTRFVQPFAVDAQ